MHELKIPQLFYRLISAKKQKLHFLLVENAHRYRTHDGIKLREVNDAGALTGRSCYVQIMFMIADPARGVRDGWAALEIEVKMYSDEIDIEKLKGKA